MGLEKAINAMQFISGEDGPAVAGFASILPACESTFNKYNKSQFLQDHQLTLLESFQL